ncbi:hypothetical protein RHSP_02134 [Rhizobium freirei PRF 81]|uniref:Uncharacterized protein n=1 Tax=Rhizobium freirei PRF 81 TaxID=363754 RepID=N6V780_9HYPH|nr:hypothetical protein RHSP_02134 [Rhizobium freirei PRF 81]
MVEADEHFLFGFPCGEDHLASFARMRSDDIVHLGRQAFRAQRIDDELALEGAIGRIGILLQRAAAAGAIDAMRAEVATVRLLPIRRHRRDRHQRALALHPRNSDGFARQREGHVDRAISALGDAVALSAELLDGDVFSAHGLIPARRNSWLPSPPAIGESMRPRLRQPISSANQRSSSAATDGAEEGSFSRPFLPIASRPASNCGFTSSAARAPGSASASAGARASFSEMKETSETTNEMGRPISSGVRLRAFSPSILVTRGSAEMRGCIWPWPTSMEVTWAAPRCSSTSVKPPVDAPTSRHCCPCGSRPKWSSAATSFNAARET